MQAVPSDPTFQLSEAGKEGVTPPIGETSCGDLFCVFVKFLNKIFKIKIKGKTKQNKK